ncbi:MAG: transposase [Azospirillum sp.]|nr:transposase [Azospirillum sp.]
MGAKREILTSKRRSFTDEFKREAVAVVESSGRPLDRVAKALDLQPSVSRTWRGRVAGPVSRDHAFETRKPTPAHGTRSF